MKVKFFTWVIWRIDTRRETREDLHYKSTIDLSEVSDQTIIIETEILSLLREAEMMQSPTLRLAQSGQKTPTKKTEAWVSWRCKMRSWSPEPAVIVLILGLTCTLRLFVDGKSYFIILWYRKLLICFNDVVINVKIKVNLESLKEQALI